MDLTNSGTDVTHGRRPRTPRRAMLAALTAILLAASLLWSPFPVPLAAADDAPRATEPSLPGDAPWTWPVDGAQKVTAPFRAPAHRYGPGHRGMDIMATGALRSPASGMIAFRGTVVDRGVITIDHGDGYVITLEPVSSVLSPGDLVEAGQVIAETSTGGHAVTGTVHVGVRLNDEYVNPRPLFGQVPRAILYPCCDSG